MLDGMSGWVGGVGGGGEIGLNELLLDDRGEWVGGWVG